MKNEQNPGRPEKESNREDELQLLAQIPKDNPNPVFQIDNNCRLLWKNKAAELFCHNCRMEIGGPVCELLSGVCRESVRQHKPIRREISCGDKYILVISQPIDGHFNLFCVDITESKQAQQALHRSEEKFSRFFHNSPNFAFMSDMDTGELIEVNEAFCVLTGYSRQEMIGHTSVELNLYPAEVREQLVRHVGQRKYIKNEEFKIQNKSGEMKTVLFSMDQMTLGGQTVFVGSGSDITKRKEVEEMMKRYQLLAMHSRDIILFLDRISGQILEANAAALDAYGYSRSELMEMTVFDLRADKVTDVIKNQMTKADLEGVLFEALHQRKDGSTFPVEISSQGAQIGGTHTLISVIRDITERKEAEAALRRSEQRFRKVLEIDTVGVLFFDMESNFLDANDEFLRLIGYDRDALRKGELNSEMVTLPEWMERTRQAFDELDATGRLGSYEKELIRPDGSRWWGLFAGKRLSENEAVKFVIDITDRKEAEKELRASEAKLNAIIDSMPVGILIADSNGRIVRFNEGTCKLWNVPPETSSWEDYGKWVGWWPETGERIKPHEWGMARALNNGEVVQGELVKNQKFGSEEHRYFINNAVPLRDSDGLVIGGLVVMQDVTERIAAQKALKELTETLEQRVSERTEQLRALAVQLSQAEQQERKRLAKVLHDHLQQLIVGAKMQLSWMTRIKDLDKIELSVERIDSILQEAIDASRSLAVDLSPPILHQAGLVGGLRWLASDMHKRNGFKVDLQLDKQAEPTFEAVQYLIFESVRELLLNAIKHSGVSRGKVFLSKMPEGQIKLVVSDEGKGFDPGVLENRQPDDVSIGLFSIQERLTYLGGQMIVESAPGEGTRVTLVVPDTGESEEAKKNAVMKEAHKKRVKVRHKSELCRVLIVDDHKIMREGLVQMLSSEPGLEVVGQAADGREALAKADELSPDVIIMDVNLGEMSGVEVTKQILHQHPEIRVIGLSMHRDRDVAEAMLEAGACDYRTKSDPSEELIKVVRSCAPSSKFNSGR